MFTIQPLRDWDFQSFNELQKYDALRGRDITFINESGNVGPQGNDHSVVKPFAENKINSYSLFLLECDVQSPESFHSSSSLKKARIRSRRGRILGKFQ